MIDAKSDIKKLISNLYERQKRIILSRRFIKDYLQDGNMCEVQKLQADITRLEILIREFQQQLAEKYHDHIHCH